MAQVTSLSELRKFYGLSQEFLGFYFGVSRSLLNMAERHERSLPLPAMEKLVALMQFTNAQPAPPVIEKNKAAKRGDNNKNKLQRLATDCKLMVYKLDQQLAEAKKLYEQSIQAKNLAAFLATQTTANEKEKEDLTLWLTVLQNDANRKEKRYGPQAQAVLQWKLDWYTYGEMRAKELSEKIEG